VFVSVCVCGRGPQTNLTDTPSVLKLEHALPPDTLSKSINESVRDSLNVMACPCSLVITVEEGERHKRISFSMCAKPGTMEVTRGTIWGTIPPFSEQTFAMMVKNCVCVFVWVDVTVGLTLGVCVCGCVD
jgi:hypothetical protein